MAEYEPNDSRNVTGTAATRDGRWTGQAAPPNAAGQQQARQAQGGAQQGGASGAGRPHVLFTPDAELEQSVSAGSGEGDLASRITSHMMVVDAEGRQVGTVDSLDGSRIKLTRSGSPDGEHHYLALDRVASVEGNAVRLREGGNGAFGMNGD